uniref:Cadherin domain-containing protein n=1 Tax=Echeneis naucrates TaxID=173247 RepID=A0A665UMX5_ECHNA
DSSAVLKLLTDYMILLLTFRRDIIYLDISEATPKGERFSLSNAVDPDVGSNSVKTYQLSESEYFNIEVQTGRDGSKFADLILTKTLDREQQAVHNLILTAVDGGTPARSGTASVIVRVMDTNDNAPTFEKKIYNINLLENSPIGSLVIHLNATDLDEGSNSEITYSYSLYTSEKTQETFNLNPSTGEITVRGMLNYEDFRIYDMESFQSPVNENIKLDTVIAVVNREKVPEYDITFTVTDRGAPPLSDNETMTLELLDVNDNVPQFPQSFYTIRVMENNAPGALLSSLTAFDPDLHENQYLVYFILEKEIANTSMSMLFSINPENGNLYKALDREQQAVHNLILTAVDGGVPTRTGTASIIVRVLDVNDNAPSFEKDRYVVDVMENSPIGSLVMKLNATDLDEGSNSEIGYSYSLYTSERTQNMFNLNPENGEIRVKEMINYEDVKLYEMEIIASDKGQNSLSGQCKLKIQVTDMNDNHPEISIKSFRSPIKEDEAIDTVIAVVSVSDKDSGDNGVVDLHIPDNMPFKLRESSDNYYELVVSEALDREKVPEYDITFTVTDRGAPPLSDNETMTLELLDVNDNVPQFPQSFYTIRVMENNAPGALLSSLTAFDPDLHENQYLVYFILEKEIANTSMSMLFSINPENGNLYALKTFDYEIEKEFLFHIEARDSGSPPLSSNVTVHIIIVDQNDNAPVIVSPWRAHGSVVEEKIPRSTDKGSLVAKVIALDTDSVHNSRITYQFLQVTDATLFSLDQYNGEIRTMRMFSYRDPRHQRLVVVAKDNGEPALSATVTIKLSTVETAVKAYSDMTEVPLEYDIFSDLNLYLVIGLGSVSFLLLITILVTIVLKCQKAKPSKAAPPCRNSVISERNSTIADSTLVSNDAYWYSLFLAETRKGKLVVRQPVPKGSRYIVSSIPRGTGLTDTSDSAASTLQVG